jgi:uncharacterized protein YcnI
VPTPRTRLTLGGLLGLATLALGAGPAAAHVSPDKGEVPAGGFTAVTFSVGHGCDGSPTRELAIQVPEAILNVTPQVHPGWDVAVETAVLAEPAAGPHGEEITERDAVVTYTALAGNELPEGFRDTFTLGFQAPDTPGETLYFNTIQSCVEGETAWIEEDPDAEAPAPRVLVAEAEAGGHGGSDADDDAATEVATETVASTTDDSSSSDALAVGGLVLGALGLATGGAALAKSRETA